MDLNFAEVAFIIQDSRFAHAIVDSDVPKPERKFPAPPRGFSPATFVRDNEITPFTVMFEPIGRFFLQQVVKTVEEEEVLKFTDSICELRKMDPSEIVQVSDIEAVCERFKIHLDVLDDGVILAEEEGGEKLDLERAGGGKLTQQVSNLTANTDDANSTTVEEVSVDMPRGGSSSPILSRGGGAGGGLSSTTNMITPIAPSRSLVALRMSLQAGDNDERTFGSQQGTSRIMSFQSEIPQRFDERVDMSTGQPMSSYYNNHVRAGGAHHQPAQTYSAAVNAATMRKRAQEGKAHSPQCLRMNKRVTKTVRNRLQACYERLVSNERLFYLYCAIKWYSMQPVTERDVRYHRVLGKGAFGTVNGCVIMCLGTMLAIKTMDKKRIKAKKAKSQVTAERDALEALAAHSSPYCLKLRYSYETKEAFHFILPVAVAGDLKYHLKSGPFSFARARYYAAEVALGLAHLHSLGLVIRDLKPRNILLTRAGHCQISDFGLAVTVTPQKPVIHGRAGTEGYWSPEVINGLAYSMDADWWSYGVCLFEFIAGISPFSTKHTGLKTRNDGTRRAEIRFPERFEESARPLVLALLNRRVTERVQGINDVLNEQRWAYWKDFDIAAVRRNEMPPPWLPERGHIYAASQGEIHENDDGKDLRRIKVLPEDAIPFTSFVDVDGHQRDIVKVLESAKKLTVEEVMNAPSRTCTIS